MIDWKYAAAICVAAVVTAPAHAADQPFPSKPVRMIVPFPAGGGSDTMGRVVGHKLGERLGQQFVIENRPGAGGSIGAELAAKRPRMGTPYCSARPPSTWSGMHPAPCWSAATRFPSNRPGP